VGSWGGQQPSGNIDLDILNFALNLEYLEAEFYLRAAFGTGLSPQDIGSNPGPVIGGRQVPFSNPDIRQYAEEIARDEEAHVKFLRAAIQSFGGRPVDRPAIDIENSFKQVVPGFDPYANDNNFLVGAFVFEDVGVTAYSGAAPLITDKQVVLAKAAGILAVEAYHAGLIRLLCYERGLQSLTAQVVAKRDADGKGEDIVKAGHTNIVPADANAVAFARPAEEGAGGAPGGGQSTRGGFAPEARKGTAREEPTLPPGGARAAADRRGRPLLQCVIQRL